MFKKWVSWAKAISMANNFQENKLSVLVEVIIAEKIVNDVMLGILIPMPITPFLAELFVKIAWLVSWAEKQHI